MLAYLDIKCQISATFCSQRLKVTFIQMILLILTFSDPISPQSCFLQQFIGYELKDYLSKK